MKLKAVLVLQLILTVGVLVSSAQSSFDFARLHNHVASTTFEGVWLKRMEPIKDQYPLGSRLAVKGTTEMWFWYGFDPLKDGPMIATAESTPSGMRVRVTYDPVCFYITKLELLGPVLPLIPRPTPDPIPTPVPSPTPTPLTTDFVWPTKLAEQRILREQVRREGWKCSMPPYSGRIWCERPSPN